MSNNVSATKKNVFTLVFLQFSQYFIPLLTLPYLVRTLEAENYGKVILAQAVVQYFIIFTDYGFNLSATRRVAIHRDDNGELSKLFWSVTLIKIFLAIAGLLLLTGLILFFPGFKPIGKLSLIAYVSVLGVIVFPVWFLQGLEKMKLMAGCVIGAQFICTILIFTLIKNTEDYYLAVLLQASTGLLCSVFLLVSSFKGISFHFDKPSVQYVLEVARDGWHVFTSNVAVSLYGTTNVLILGAFAGNMAVGHFNAADKIVRAVQAILSPIGTAVFPHIARLKNESSSLALDLIRKVFWIQLAINIFMSGILFFGAPYIIFGLYGNGFSESIFLLKILSALPLLVALSNTFGIQTMINFNLSREFGRILIFAGLVNIAGLVYLAPVYAATGAAMSLLLTELLVTVVMACVLLRKGLLPSLLKMRNK